MASLGLNIGLKALLSARAGLDTVGHNIANANTPGYSRQRLELSASPSQILRGIALGSGVDADTILRTADALLHRRLVAQTAALGQAEARLAGMSQLESLLGEPGDQGLAALLADFGASLGSLAASPEDTTAKSGVVQSSAGLAARFHDIAASVSAVRRDQAATIATTVDSVNTLAADVAKLNREIATLERGGLAANDLRDARDQALNELGRLVQVSVTERPSGAVSVTTNGALLVGESRSYEMSARVAPDGATTVTLENHPGTLTVKSGSLAGMLRLTEEFLPSFGAKLDLFAKQLIFETNRAHSTGMPKDGAFHALTSSYSVRDFDGDGASTDELIAGAGLPFDVSRGQLFVHVSDDATGALSTHSIEIDPAAMTVADLIAAFDDVPHLSAGLDSFGRLQVSSDPGYGFDFSRRVATAPDVAGTFGGSAATLGTALAQPFALADGDTLSVTGPNGAFAITFDDADFADIAHATAGELKAVLDADPAFAASGLRAVEVGERLMLQSQGGGASSTFTIDGGTSLTALGWSGGQTASGQANPVEVTVSGTFTGTANDEYTFVPLQDGTIGTTAGLQIAVLDARGAQVALLDVGAGYQPGAPIALPHGLAVSFGLGGVSASAHQAFTLDVLADSDTSDVLAAFGLNSYFTGTSASDIAVRADIERDPDAMSVSHTGASGDNTAIRDMLATHGAAVDGLGGNTLSGFYGDVVAGVGFEISSADSAREVDQFLLDSLTSRRDEISGVNVDEELVDMIAFEQAFSAASRYISVVNATNDEILNLI